MEALSYVNLQVLPLNSQHAQICAKRARSKTSESGANVAEGLKCQFKETDDGDDDEARGEGERERERERESA